MSKTIHPSNDKPHVFCISRKLAHHWTEVHVPFDILAAHGESLTVRLLPTTPPTTEGEQTCLRLW